MNNQNDSSSSANNEGIQRMIHTSTDMDRSNQKNMAKSMGARPISIIKVYAAKQEEWKAKIGAESKSFTMDTLYQTKKNPSFFLIEYVSKRGKNYRRQSVNGYMKVVASIYNTKKALGWNNNGLTRGPLVKNSLDTSEKEKFKIQTVLSYKPCNIIHSQIDLGMKFTDLISLEVENQGLTQCIALVATISHVKTS
ncbi:hypothetical protein PHYBLDRAFT_71943 [Phycomyces blakesleeanus NRRL 1555(-)]|uniref:Uncharacterized protein n=1 Tax=Phycomyces blakesleeanus (strain ATCC 8743b / DSM 1359 / FGSC 10004 / NBRC 33097 / NRRL 1555) TaxID=763407 RepID=A0A167JSR2_PHYB8|nr:hypothetical protein PHYBLDRAFT_71943 [Phycomyces blakesleeanus NRRL 1555(-)]OAD66628.1 hypothetical protein PHYBLDRAFT_71943 [Phycomyces blakesleeanus NRRL 1555(-)]|eukprot:XP_018284668.1 hypothetical protein PHYBLDRAFT_71943 [Phycomyces blakesleeanus NRRL 1555(-)]